MRCGEARKELYLSERPGTGDLVFPVDARAVQAQFHMTGCAACREFFAAEARLRGLVKSTAPRDSAPQSLRESVLARIAREREASKRRSPLLSFRRFRGPVAVAIVIALAVTAAAILWLGRRKAAISPEMIASVLIADHAHNLAGEAEIASRDRAVVESWFEGKLDFRFHLPPATDRTLIGGRLCSLQGKRAALIFYREPRSRTSLFVLDASDIVLPENQLVGIDGKHCMIDSARGYNAVIWKDRGVLYGLVSDARSADLLQLASQF